MEKTWVMELCVNVGESLKMAKMTCMMKETKEVYLSSQTILLNELTGSLEKTVISATHFKEGIGNHIHRTDNCLNIFADNDEKLQYAH